MCVQLKREAQADEVGVTGEERSERLECVQLKREAQAPAKGG